MNKVILIGRLTKDPELASIADGTSRCRFTVAVDRPYSRNDSEKQADFISATAWRQQADFVAKYFRKGSPIALEGSIRTGSYDAKDGTKKYTTEVYVDRVEFVSSKSADSENAAPIQKRTQISDLETIKEDDSDLPF